jgi:hypothetical protein
MGLPRNNQSRF